MHVKPKIHSPAHEPAGRQRARGGMTMIELVVSCVLLITVMSLVTTLCLQINLVWKDIGHHRIAMAELSNQMEMLTRLTPQDARKAVQSLKPSSNCSRTLKAPKLVGEVTDDELGIRIQLQIDWSRRHPGMPITLIGWLIAMDAENEDPVPGQTESESPPSQALHGHDTREYAFLTDIRDPLRQRSPHRMTQGHSAFALISGGPNR